MCKIRPATGKDFQDICGLIDSKDEMFLVHPGGKYPFTVSQVKELSRLRKELTVAVEGNKIVGFANLYNIQPDRFAFVGNVVIDKNYRGRGIGKKIVSHMLKIAHEKYNLPEARISVFSDNSKALLLYAGFGFVPYDIEERKNPQGARVALIHMKMAYT